MSFLKKIFGSKNKINQSTILVNPSDLEKNPGQEKIQVFDAYGREMWITKDQWRVNILPGSLKKAENDPQELYFILRQSLQDGFSADVVSYAEHLQSIDPNSVQSALILGVIYIDVNRLDDAQRTFEDYMSRCGEDGYILTNLAKVYSKRGDDKRAESTLWHALELDPNQENAMGWYSVMQKERAGSGAYIDALKHIAELPKSWRARLWLAREALEQKNYSSAEGFYHEALLLADDPKPFDMLVQIGSDLGRNGYFDESIRWTEPYFDPKIHGMAVGNNLIKANIDLGRFEEAKRLLNILHSMQRPEWSQALRYWETELAKLENESRSKNLDFKEVTMRMVAIEGPLWARDQSPLQYLVPSKVPNAPRILIIGSTVISDYESNAIKFQIPDEKGRLSRALPLIMSEYVHLKTDGSGSAVIPYIVNHGFAVLGKPYEDLELINLIQKHLAKSQPAILVYLIIDATQPTWKTEMRILDVAKATLLSSDVLEINADIAGQAAKEMAELLVVKLEHHAGVSLTDSPDWYQVPKGVYTWDYCVRLEQLVTLLCANQESLGESRMYDIRGMLEGGIQICVAEPQNPTVRFMMLQMLRQLKKYKPDILMEYKDKVLLLQREHHLSLEFQKLITAEIDKIFG